MWRRPNEPRPASPEPEPYVPPAPVAPPHREELAPAPASRAPEATHITHAISIRGHISGEQDLFIDGELQGGVNLPASRVTVGQNGRLKADVEAGEIIVEGQVNGDLVAGTRLHIRRTGRVYGRIITPRLAIDEGAVLNGQVEMTAPGAALTQKTAAAVPAFRAATP